jgi:hypothetical protein
MYKSLHIIQNFNNYKVISKLIIQNVSYKFNNIYKIFYQKNYINLKEKFFKNQKIYFNNSIKIIFMKILK